ncbi:MAG TPA: dTMP kinase [Dehalococcoidia bacterium]|nr:dTMP kinase [Dehalococcoidia bacterium]
MVQRGRFIVLEGGEGAGKSRLQAALGDRLRSAGYAVDLRREPGGTPLGERVRELINAEALDDPLAELLLFEAARTHLVATAIRPALASGTHVLCDRFTASSVAYQAFGRGLDRATVERANAIATGGLAPDLVLLLDLPPEVGLRRRHGGGDVTHFDALPLAFHERVRAGYVELAREHGDTWRIIDATQPFEAVLAAASDVVMACLERAPA